MRYTHILFDHDGVLVDTEQHYFAATAQHLAELGVTLTQADYLAVQAYGGDAWAQARANGVSDAKIAATKGRRNETYQTMLRSEPIDIPGVEDTLSALGSRVSMAIVTTAKPEDFELIHANRNIVPHMAFVLDRSDYDRAKPHPEPYLTALQRFDIEPSQALVVEDSARGLGAAVAAGIDCAVVAHPFTATQDFSSARYRIDNLGELLDLVQ